MRVRRDDDEEELNRKISPCRSVKLEMCVLLFVCVWGGGQNCMNKV